MPEVRRSVCALDCPDASQLTPVRGASVTALQALALLNDKFIVRQSEHVAARIARAHSGVEAQVAAAYRLIKAALALVRRVASMLDFTVDTGELESATVAYERQLTETES